MKYLVILLVLFLCACGVPSRYELPTASIVLRANADAPSDVPLDVPATSTPQIVETPTPNGPLLDVLIDDGLYDQGDTERRVQEAYTYVSGRFGSPLTVQSHIVFVTSPGCKLDGVSHPEYNTTQVTTCSAFGVERAMIIMAHEIVHLLTYEYYGKIDQPKADLMLEEGLATYCAGMYWGTEDFRYNDGAPLLNDWGPDQLGNPEGHNAVYMRWASFVQFLLQSYGREKFDAVYRTGAGAPGSANYVSVYGKDIGTLEQEWRAQL